MKYVLFLLGMLVMSEVVQMKDVRVIVKIRVRKKRALAPQIERKELVDARDAVLSPEERQELTNDLQEKIKGVVEKERKKFHF